MISLKKTLALCTLAIVLLPLFPAQAFQFDPNNIISDNDLTNQDAMSLDSIQSFLESQPGTLATYVAVDYFGKLKRASEIIFDASQRYHISPKVLLTKLQKEQSLVTDPRPTQYQYDWAMGYGVCDDCSVNDPLLQKFKGFGNQVDRAAWRNKVYIDEGPKFNFQPGITRIVDGVPVTPFNRATANLYNYTPHLHGNTNFWKIWNRWFAKQFPDGTLVRQDGTAGVWLIDNGYRRPFWSKAALKSRYPNAKVVSISRNDLDRYDVGQPIKYANYSLVQSPAGAIYLLVNDEKKLIASNEVFKTLGYNPAEVEQVTDEELAPYADGRMITMESVYPTGALLKDMKSGGVYFVEDGIKYPIWTKEILTLRFGASKKVAKATTDQLTKYPTGQPVKLLDGTLIQVKGSKAVYVISDSTKHLIANQQTFEQLGYKKEYIQTVTTKTLEAHPDGDPIDLLIPTPTPGTTIAAN